MIGSEFILFEYILLYLLIMSSIFSTVFGVQFLILNWSIYKYELEWHSNKYDRKLKILELKIEKLK